MFQENSKNEEVHLYFVTTNKAAWLINIIHYYKKKCKNENKTMNNKWVKGLVTHKKNQKC